MADNYLEGKFEELHSNKGKRIIKNAGQPLDLLLLKNRSCRGYDPSVPVNRGMLKRLAAVCTKVPSARNQQALRFKLVTRENGADIVLHNVKMGAGLPELHLPFEGTAPEAFIVICSTVPENKMVDIDLGICAQSILLKAVESGLNGLIIGAFNKNELTDRLHLPYEPLLVIAVGKSIESIRMTEIAAEENHGYYRKDGIHYVPKVRIDDLLIPDRIDEAEPQAAEQ